MQKTSTLIQLMGGTCPQLINSRVKSFSFHLFKERYPVLKKTSCYHNINDNCTYLLGLNYKGFERSLTILFLFIYGKKFYQTKEIDSIRSAYTVVDDLFLLIS